MNHPGPEVTWDRSWQIFRHVTYQRFVTHSYLCNEQKVTVRGVESKAVLQSYVIGIHRTYVSYLVKACSGTRGKICDGLTSCLTLSKAQLLSSGRLWPRALPSIR